ncbi:MAG: molybdate ABC transporter substrate-binding protein [Caldilineaceae bacterium]|nr:molybdate ABC transporter substrate-binding protein [Caldilineaceae bacterium]
MVAGRMRWISGLLILLALLGGCTAQIAPPGGSAPARRELIVLAAASLTEAFTELGEQFQAAHPGVTVLFSFAGSQQLAQQLAQGAPADVFASANRRQMAAAIDAGRVLSDSTQVFVNNRLVVIYPSDNPAGLASLHDLAQPGVKLVLAAPAVPVGEYALNFLDKASATVEYGATYSPTVLANVVSYEENVRGVLGKVSLGEADAGIVYTSDIAAGSADQVGQIEIPDALNTVAAYPIAPVADADHPDLAQAFVDLVLSPAGQAVLARHGFVPVAQP